MAKRGQDGSSWAFSSPSAKSRRLRLFAINELGARFDGAKRDSGQGSRRFAIPAACSRKPANRNRPVLLSALLDSRARRSESNGMDHEMLDRRRRLLKLIERLSSALAPVEQNPWFSFLWPGEP